MLLLVLRLLVGCRRLGCLLVGVRVFGLSSLSLFQLFLSLFVVSFLSFGLGCVGCNPYLLGIFNFLLLFSQCFHLFVVLSLILVSNGDLRLLLSLFCPVQSGI